MVTLPSTPDVDHTTLARPELTLYHDCRSILVWTHVKFEGVLRIVRLSGLRSLADQKGRHPQVVCNSATDHLLGQH